MIFMHVPDGVVVDGGTVPGFVDAVPGGGDVPADGGTVGVPADTVDGVVPNEHRLYSRTWIV